MPNEGVFEQSSVPVLAEGQVLLGFFALSDITDENQGAFHLLVSDGHGMGLDVNGRSVELHVFELNQRGGFPFSFMNWMRSATFAR